MDPVATHLQRGNSNRIEASDVPLCTLSRQAVRREIIYVSQILKRYIRKWRGAVEPAAILRICLNYRQASRRAMTHCPAAPFSRRADRPPRKRAGRKPMTPAAAISRDHPDTLFATPSIVADRRADGSIMLRSTVPLERQRALRRRLAGALGARDAGADFPRRARQCRRAMDHGHLQGRARNRAVGRGLDSGARAERGPSACHPLRQQHRSRAVGAGGDACRRALGRDLAGLFADVQGL